MKRFIAATKNRGKLKEIAEILADFPIRVVSMEEAGFDMDIEENGSSFLENALIKAKMVVKAAGEIVMADDSGLAVDYLDGAPGIYSARFAGEGASDEDRNKKLLGLLKSVSYEKRTARFICVIAVVFPDGRYFTVNGTCEGYIGDRIAGMNGFGYDPLFYIPEYKKTIAELDLETKNRISHRGRALRQMADELGNGWLDGFSINGLYGG